MLISDFQNPFLPYDVDDNGDVAPIDALIIINDLNRRGPRDLNIVTRQEGERFIDVNGDAASTPIDALLIINALNRGTMGDYIVLSETSGQFVQQAVRSIELNSVAGVSTTITAEIRSRWDRSDTSAPIGDRLLVSLRDRNSPQTTLVDRGQTGTTLMVLGEQHTELASDVVQWDTRRLTIETSELDFQGTAELVFQLVDSDSDNSGIIVVADVTVQTSEESANDPQGASLASALEPGGNVNIEDFELSNEAVVEVLNPRFSTGLDVYAFELGAINIGIEPIREIVFAFPNLPTNLEIENASGQTEFGVPYISLPMVATTGFLEPGARSNSVHVVMRRSGNEKFDFQPQVWTRSGNLPPTLEPINPLTVFPGSVSRIQLDSFDEDNDELFYSMLSEAREALPIELSTDGTITVRPRPSDLGSHNFIVRASDGLSHAEQTWQITVVEDFDTTTRVSGVVLDINGHPIPDVPVSLSRANSLTDSEGRFTLILPDDIVPTERFSIRIPTGDPWFDPQSTGTKTISMFRAVFDPFTGDAIDNPRRHPSNVSHYLEGGIVYGFDESRASSLRTFVDGQLISWDTPVGELLPLNSIDFFPGGPLENESGGGGDPSQLFVAGDVRASENVGLATLHTLLMREHNRLAKQIQVANPAFDDEMIYQAARRLVIAQVQNITYQEYLPMLLGSDYLDAYGGYDEAADPEVSKLFTTAAFRLGHSQTNETMWRIEADESPDPAGDLSLRAAFFNAQPIVESGIDNILRGMITQPARRIDTQIVDALRNFLFGPPGSGGLDLAALNIQRGRDLGLPNYNQARIDFGLSPVSNFEQISSDSEVQATLQMTYGDVDTVDAWVGMLAEDHVDGAMVGELTRAVMLSQFRRTRIGDRFWYENEQLTEDELNFVRETSMSDLISRNSNVTPGRESVFTLGERPAGPPAGGAASADLGAEYRSYDGYGNNPQLTSLGGIGRNLVHDFTTEYGDGQGSPSGSARPNPRTISNQVMRTSDDIIDPRGATAFLTFWGQLISHDLALSPTGATETIRIHGDETPSVEDYPFVAEELSYLLERPVFAGNNNVIDRPIYLPAIDFDGGTVVDPNNTTLVTSSSITNASVMVEAGTLRMRDGGLFSDVLSITEVPSDRTPATLPQNLTPALVVTIQPAELSFDSEAPLTLPNVENWAPGTEMDLWSINPVTGLFERVGTGLVSADGSIIETVEGGIRNSSWHFFSPPEPVIEDITIDDDCVNCRHGGPGGGGGCDIIAVNMVARDNSSVSPPVAGDLGSTPTAGGSGLGDPICRGPQVSSATGNLTLPVTLFAYRAKGELLGGTLMYDASRANPQATLSFRADNAAFVAGADRVVASATISRGGTKIAIGEGDSNGNLFWSLPASVNTVQGSVTANLRTLPSGTYDYEMQVGLGREVAGSVSRVSSSLNGTISIVNGASSPFGVGWEFGGLEEIITNPDGSLLVTNGDGTRFSLKKSGNEYESAVGDLAVTTKLSSGEIERIYPDQSRQLFGTNGKLTSVRDRVGHETRYIYNAQNQLVQIFDAAGQATTFEYAGQFVSRIVDPGGRVTSLQHDPSGNLIRVTHPDQSQTQFRYDTQNRLIQQIDPEGRVTSFRSDASGQTSEIVHPDQSTEKFVSAIAGFSGQSGSSNSATAPLISEGNSLTAQYTQENGRVLTTQLDLGGQLVSQRDGLGLIKRYRRAPETNLIFEEVTGNGVVTEYTHNATGQVIVIRDPIAGLNDDGEALFPELLIGLPGIVHQIETADLNVDGRLDLVGVYESNGIATLGVQFNLGDGRFDDNYVQTLTPGVFYSLATADINDDGRLDILVTETASGQPGVLRVYLGSIATAFATPRIYQLPGGQVTGLQVHDLNGDGLLDLAITADTRFTTDGAVPRPGTLVTLHQQSDGDFTNATLNDLGAIPGYLQLNDINDDSVVDFIIGLRAANNSQAWIASVPRGANGEIGQPTVLLTSDGSVSGGTNTLLDMGQFVVNDLNSDGFNDLAAIVLPSGLAKHVAIRYGQQSGNFSAPELIPLNSTAEHGIEALDWDNDGDLDLVAIGGDFVRSLRQDAGEFTLAATSIASRAGNDWAFADLDDDGLNDLLTVHNTSGSGNDASSLGVLLRTGNGSGAFGSVDSGEQLASTSLRSPIVADFNSDGFPDAAILTTENTPSIPQGINILIGDGSGDFTDRLIFEAQETLTAISVVPRKESNTVDLVGRYDSGIITYVNDGTGRFSEQAVLDFTAELPSAGVASTSGLFHYPQGTQDTPLIAVAWRGLLFNGGSVNSLSVLSIDSGAISQQQRFALPGRPISVTADDLNGDGFVDWVVSGFNVEASRDEVWVYFGDGDSSWTALPSVLEDVSGTLMIPWKSSPSALPHLITATFSRLNVWQYDDETNRWSSRAEFSLFPGDLLSLSTADVNRDGYDDVWVAGEDGRYAWMINDQAGGLMPRKDYIGGSSALSGATIGDLNGDGNVDVLLTDNADKQTRLRLNQLSLHVAGRSPQLFTYDTAHKQLSSFTDELGRLTIFTLDPATGNRLEQRIVQGEVGGEDDLVTSYEYNGMGLLTAVVDPGGRRTEYAYDNQCHLTEIVEAVGTSAESRTAYTYDGVGNLLSITDAMGHVTTYTYDAFGRILSMVEPDPDGDGEQSSPVTHFTYDLVGNLIEVIDPLGHVTKYEHASRNRLLATINAAGYVSRRRYDPSGNLISSLDELGREMFFEYDQRDRNTHVIDAIGGVTKFSYDLNDQLVAITDPLGRVQQMQMDVRGRMISWSDPLNQVQQMVYNAADEIVRIIDRSGNATAFQYDDAGRRIATIDALGQREIESVDQVGNVVSITDRLGRTTEYLYDSLDRVVQISDALGGEFIIQYDLNGNVIKETDQLGRETLFEFDALNRLTLVTSADGGETQFFYDASGRLLKEVDPLGRETAYEYDSINRLISYTDALGHVTSFEYDKRGNLIRSSDRLERATTYAYDRLERLISMTDPTGAVHRFSYDAVGNRVSKTDPLGRVSSTIFDELDRQSVFIYPDQSEVRYEYDAVGNVTAVIDAINRRTEYSYDTLYRLGSVVDPAQQRIVYTHDAEGNRISTTDQLGRVSTYRVDALDRVVEFTDALENHNHYAYDLVGNLLSFTDANGATTTYQYDAMDRNVATTDAMGGVAQWQYDAVGNLVAFTDEVGSTMSFIYDNLNRLVQQTNPLGDDQRFRYDEEGNIVEAIDLLGRSTFWQYDGMNRRTAEINPKGASKTWTYDGIGNLLNFTDELGRATHWDYDSLDQVIRYRDGLGNVTQWQYDPVGRMAAEIDPLGRQNRFTYDDLDRLISLEDAAGGVRSWTYDVVGNLLTTADELGNIWQNEYDAIDRLVRNSDPLGNASQFVYDSVGNLIEQIDPLGRTTTNQYDLLYRLISTTDAAQQQTTFNYDAIGNLLSVTDPLANITNYSYDVLHRVTQEVDPRGFQTSYIYDAAGNLIRSTDRNGREIEYRYDVLDRLISEKWLDSEQNSIEELVWEYDAAGQLTSAANSNSLIVNDYDAAGRVARTTQSWAAVDFDLAWRYQYDAADQLIQKDELISDEVAATTIAVFDPLGQLKSLTRSGSETAGIKIDFNYDSAKRLISVSRFSFMNSISEIVSTQYAYDSANRLVNLTHSSGGEDIAQYQWTFDAAAQIIDALTPFGTSQFAYDEIGQLVEATHSSISDEAYEYDQNGNRINSGYQTSTGNRLMSDATFDYTYDNEGNRVSRTNRESGVVDRYQWDYRNRLVAVTSEDEAGSILSKVVYDYDPFDRRIAKHVDADGDGSATSTTTYFGLEGDNVVLVLSADGTVLHHYLHGPVIDQILADENHLNDIMWPLADHLGTVHHLIDSTGQVVDQRNYDSFGNLHQQANPEIDYPFGFTGREFDTETGLYYYRARYYDANVGRFISEDPLGFAAGDANLFRYVGNGPTNASDPWGLEEFTGPKPLLLPGVPKFDKPVVLEGRAEHRTVEPPSNAPAHPNTPRDNGTNRRSRDPHKHPAKHKARPHQNEKIKKKTEKERKPNRHCETPPVSKPQGGGGSGIGRGTPRRTGNPRPLDPRSNPQVDPTLRYLEGLTRGYADVSRNGFFASLKLLIGTPSYLFASAMHDREVADLWYRESGLQNLKALLDKMAADPHFTEQTVKEAFQRYTRLRSALAKSGNPQLLGHADGEALANVVTAANSARNLSNKINTSSNRVAEIARGLQQRSQLPRLRAMRSQFDSRTQPVAPQQNRSLAGILRNRHSQAVASSQAGPVLSSSTRYDYRPGPRTILGDAFVDAEIRRAWNESAPYSSSPREQGLWIYYNQISRSIETQRWPTGTSHQAAPSTPDLNNGRILIGGVHVHPNDYSTPWFRLRGAVHSNVRHVFPRGQNNYFSEADHRFAVYYGVTQIIETHEGRFVTLFNNTQPGLHWNSATNTYGPKP